MFKGRRIIAALLSVIMLLPWEQMQVLATEPAGQAQEENSGNILEDVLSEGGVTASDSTRYYEVKFELPPDFAWAEDAEAVVADAEAAAAGENAEGTAHAEDDIVLADLPETMMLKEGTLISSIPEPQLMGYVFLGWYYDDDLTLRAATKDVVDRNMTLYPKFGSAAEEGDVAKMDYVTAQGVEQNYEMVLAAYGEMDEDEIRKSLLLHDAGSLEEEKEYTLTLRAPVLSLLFPEKEMQEQVQKILDGYQDDVKAAAEWRAAKEAEAAEAAAKESEAQAACSEDMTEEETEPETLPEPGPGRWEKPDGSGFIEGDDPGEISLVSRLLEAGLTKEQIRPLALYYAPEEAAGLTSAQEAADAETEETADTEDAAELSCPVLYRIMPAEGHWRAGITQQAELLDTQNLRFYKDGEITESQVVYYNVITAQDNYNDMRLGSGVVDILAAEVEGIDLKNGSMIQLTQNEYGDLEAVKNDRSGTFTYYGTKDLTVGTVACVHEEGYDFHNAIGAVGDYPITYLKITEDLGGGQYAYIMPEVDEIVFTPDNIPLLNDGNFEDGQILVPFEQLDFSDPMYDILGLDENTVIEPGDLLTLIDRNEADPDNSDLAGYGRIRAVSQEDGGLRIAYDIVTEEEFDRTGGFAQHMDNVPFNLTDEELKQVADNAIEELEEKNAVSDVQDYISALIMAEDYELQNPEFADAINSITFDTDTGEKMTLEEVRKLADGFGWDEKAHLQVQVAFAMKHFHGTGVRLVISYSMGGSIKAGAKGQIRVQATVQFEMECALGVSGDSWLKWGKTKILGYTVKYPAGWDLYGAVDAGFFFAIGLNVTVQTQSAPSGSGKIGDAVEKGAGNAEQKAKWGAKIANLTSLMDTVNTVSNIAGEGVITDNGQVVSANSGNYTTGNSIGGSGSHDVRTKYYAKYADFLSNAAEYIPIYEHDLLPQTTMFHCGIFEVSVGVKFKLAWKLNVMIGATMQYGNCKQAAIYVTIPSFSKRTSTADLEIPNFLLDFYIFGNVGIKASIAIDMRMGIISTKLDSVGLVMEIGLQINFYGFFYLSASWESGKGWSTDAVGTMLVQAELFITGKLKAQALSDKYKAEQEVFSAKMPIASLGTERVFVDMVPTDEDGLVTEMDVTVPENGKYVKLDEKTFKVLAMEMNNGLTLPDAAKDMDSKAEVDGDHKPFTALGGTFLQKDEEFFEITVTDTDEHGKSLGHSEPSWWYDPVTNQVYPKPHSSQDGELHGQLTFAFHSYRKGGAHSSLSGDKVNSFINYGMGFGLKKEGVERVVNVHWKGTPATVEVVHHLQTDPFDGIESFEALEGASVQDLERLYQEKDTVKLPNSFVGLSTAVSAEDPVFDADENYELAFMTFAPDEDIAAVYEKNTSSEGAARAKLYKEKGYLWHLDEDTEYTFPVDQEKTVIHVYYNRIKLKSKWMLLDAESENQIDFGTTDVIIPKGDPVMQYAPESIREAMEDTKEYKYTVYAITSNHLSGLAKNRLEAGMRAWNYPSLLPSRTGWQEIEKESPTPDEDFHVFVERSPKTNMITWMYEAGARVTFVKPGAEVKPPYAGNKTGYLLDYWADEDGEQYEIMPERDLVLYPHYVGKEHNITWVYGRQRTSTTLRVGDNMLQACPYEELQAENLPENQGVRWRIGSVSNGVIVTAEDVMPDNNLVLFADLISYRTATWMLDDTVISSGPAVVGDPLTYPELELEEGKTVRWLLNKEPLPDDFVMPDEDIVLTALVYDADHEHDWQPTGDWDKPTCTEGSVRHVRCSICLEETDEELPPDPEAHIWADPVYTWDDEEGTCNAIHVCTLNEKHTETETVQVRARILEEPTCEKEGTAQLEAVFENPAFETQTREEAIPVIEHEKGEPKKENEKAATCAEEGSYEEVVYCVNCGKEISREKKTIEKTTVHTADSPKQENYVEPTCQEEGSYDRVVRCKICGEVISTVHRTVKKAKHKPGETVIENATEDFCESGGTYDEVVYCTVCGEEISRKQKKRKAPGHTPAKAVKENEKEATCTQQGSFEAVVYCSVCGEELSRETVAVPPKGHKESDAVKEKETAPTCTKEGSYESVVYCSVCHEELSRETVSVPATGHTESIAVKENETAPTCIQDGSYENVVYCKVCGEELSRETVTVAATGHTAGDAVKDDESEIAPTCTQEGSVDLVVRCSVCGEELSRQTQSIDKVPHTPAEAVKENEDSATCTKAGSYDEVVYCSVCSEELTRETKTIDQLPHTQADPVTENEVPATCMEGGSYYEVIYCSVCGTELSRTSKTIPMLTEHTPGEPVRDNEEPASCEVDGHYDSVVYCTVCHAELSREKDIVIPKTGHLFKNPQKKDVVAATCTVMGSYVEMTTCEYCGKAKYEYVLSDALGHEWANDSWFTGTSPYYNMDHTSCFGWDPGTADAKCSRCHFETKVNPVSLTVTVSNLTGEKYSGGSLEVGGNYFLDINTPDLLSQFSSADATVGDVLAGAFAYAGTSDSADFFRVDGTFTFEETAEKLRDHLGDTLLFGGSFTPVMDNVYETLNLTVRIVVPEE